MPSFKINLFMFMFEKFFDVPCEFRRMACQAATRFFTITLASPLCLCLVVVSCAPNVAPMRTTSVGSYKIGTPYFIRGVRYVPREDPSYDKVGIASWYGKKFHGRRTANGEIYDMNALTAAHPTLPMPTRVRVTNLENGKQLVLRVNDRGPFVNGRIIDVSRRAARLLGFERQGTAKVRVEYLGQAPFETFVARKPVTPGKARTAAAAAPQRKVKVTVLKPPPWAPGAAGARLLPVMKPVANKDMVETVLPLSTTDIFIQAGAFLDPLNANRIRTTLSSLGPVNVQADMIEGEQYYLVRLGPMDSVKDAGTKLAQLISMGHTQAHITIE